MFFLEYRLDTERECTKRIFMLLWSDFFLRLQPKCLIFRLTNSLFRYVYLLVDVIV